MDIYKEIVFGKISAVATYQHDDIKLESLFGDVKLLRQKLFTAEANRLSLQCVVCGWRCL